MLLRWWRDHYLQMPSFNSAGAVQHSVMLSEVTAYALWASACGYYVSTVHLTCLQAQTLRSKHRLSQGVLRNFRYFTSACTENSSFCQTMSMCLKTFFSRLVFQAVTHCCDQNVVLLCLSIRCSPDGASLITALTTVDKPHSRLNVDTLWRYTLKNADCNLYKDAALAN